MFETGLSVISSWPITKRLRLCLHYISHMVLMLTPVYCWTICTIGINNVRMTYMQVSSGEEVETIATHLKR